MKKDRSVKQRLFSAILVLVMLFTSLLGTTFAWFTDQVSSAGNQIVSGTLKVDLSVKGENDQWVSLKQNPEQPIFDYKHWEPGYTRVEQLKVDNLGTLALKYQLSIEVALGTADIGENNAKLSDVIDVYVADGVKTAGSFADITAANGWTRKGTLTEVMEKPSEFVKGQLNADGKENDNAIVTIALHMQESAGNEYQNLSAGDIFVNLIATQATVESDSFGTDYDDKAEFPEIDIDDLAIEVEVENGLVKATKSASRAGISITVPADVMVDGVTNGTATLVLSVDEKAESEANVTLDDDEILQPLDVHVEGVSAQNQKAIVITIEKAMPTGLNMGNYKLYHVENGATNVMTSVDAAGVDAHNEFYYDPATGDTTLGLATFSEVALVADTVNAWNGEFDYTWYNADVTELVIANADQLAAFGAIVGGMDGQTQDSFSGKTVKLIADVNLGDKESENNPDIIFYPIGYYNNTGSYEKVSGGSVTSNVYSFEGTFDGNGNTISNFYQNTWEMFGDYNSGYSGTPNHYKNAMGLFGYVVNGKVCNLTVDNFSSDGEFTPTGVIAAYAVNSIFENIAITNCNPRVYNTGNGGIVGIGGNSDDPDTYKLTFTNITIDNTNKITALWGSWDVACGGLVGMFRGAGHAHMTNCHVAAQIDVYNDVCGNYQYYWYRYSGMMIGTNKNMITDKDGYTVPETSKFHAENCTVHFGDWNDYYYCELVANSLASYTHDHQFSRLTVINSLDEIKSGDTWTKTGNFLLISGDTKTCYHIVKNTDGTLKQHLHTDAGYETSIDEDGDGNVDLKEDKQIVYLPFNQLFTGYGWGVKHIPVYNGEDYAFEGIKILDREVGDSHVKFEKADNAKDSYTTGTTVTIGELFKAADINDEKLTIKGDNVQVTVSPFGATSTAGGTYTANTTDWKQGTLTFSGAGAAVISITDYYFCKTTTLSITIGAAEKFDVVMNNGDFLHRVGNSGTVALNKLFKAKDGATVGTISVTVEAVDGTSASGTYSNNEIQFNGTGVVKVTIKDDDSACAPTVLYLEVVDAVNATTATSATSNNVVLLNDISSGFTVSGRYAVYGNGFTLNYTGNGQYLNNGLKQGVVTVSENGTLDNLRIVASIYPAAYLYNSEAKEGPSDGNNRYYYQLSAVAASGNATISNCYIYGGRNNIFVNTGDVTITDTILECGTLANVQIQSNSSHTVTFNNVTTIQHRVNATIGDTNQVMLGAGIVVGPETNDNPTIVLNGDFKQYNWVTADDKSAVDNETAQSIIQAALEATEYNHTVNGKTASNLGIIYMNTEDATVENKTGLPYVLGDVSMDVSGFDISGQVYSPKNATAEQIYSDYEKADRSTVNGWYQPQFKYSADLGDQYIEKDSGDEHCYREGDTINVLFPSGDTKELDLAALVNIAKYSGQDLGLVITVKDSSGNAVTVTDGKITLSDAGEYTVTYTVTDTLFYNKNGEMVTNSIEYSWDITVSVSLKDTAIPDAYFEFDSTKQKMGYYKPSWGDVKQYLPFLAGLKIYDYNGQTSYLRFDGDADFNKIASITITGYTSNEAYIEVKLTDGGVINTKFLARADSGGGSTYTGSIKIKDNVVYFVNGGGTSNKESTTTAAYWYVDYYKFTGNNGVAIQSAQQTFNSTGSSASTPTGNFSTTIKYTVTYDANEGNCGQATGYATSVATAVTLPTPTRSGYIFAGWFTAASGGTRVGGAGDSYTPSATITLYAQWGKPCTVTYNANGGSCATASEKYTGTALTLPTPTRDGYWFIGWYDAAEGGTKIGDAGVTYNPTGEITLYAHWQEKVEYTVTYNANGGSCGTASATYQGTALTLPTPTREGYTFNGWYTATSGGTKIADAGASYTPSANITLYAQWQINSYTITVTTNNATVKVNGTTVNNNGTVSIQYGAQVTVEVTYSESNSQSTTIKGTDGTTYTSPFSMPAQNVTINATSSGDTGTCLAEGTLITLADGSKKAVEDLRKGDLVMSFDHLTGEIVYKDVIIVVKTYSDSYYKNTFVFNDGTELVTINEHGIYDLDLNKYVNIDHSNYEQYLGHRFVSIDANENIGVKTLVDVTTVIESGYKYDIVTNGTLNYVAEDTLSVTHVLVNVINSFDFGDNLMYDQEKMIADIETYGLYTYDEWEEYCDISVFDQYNIPVMKVGISKGLYTKDYIIGLINTYVLDDSVQIID